MSKLAVNTSITINSQHNIPTEQVKIMDVKVQAKNNTAITSKVIASNASSEENLGVDLQ